MNKVVIVDYGMGNLNSVAKKIRKLEGNAIISSDPKEILQAIKIILPGVGHFAKAVFNLKSHSLWDALNEAVLEKQIPILGICLGMQLMTKYSEEGGVEGLGWFDAEVIKFHLKNNLRYKVPHMGWNSIHPQKNSVLFEDLPEMPEFYFVHAYHVKSDNQDQVLAYTNYEYDFVSALEKDTIFGLQFHPEKSHEVGERLIANFLKLNHVSSAHHPGIALKK